MAQRQGESGRATGKPGRKAVKKPSLAKKAAAKTPRQPKAPLELTVAAGVERDLAAISKLDTALATSGLATTARALAREIDSPKNSATSKSMCAKSLHDILGKLRDLAPEEEARDRVDELGRRRKARLGSAARSRPVRA